MLYGSRCMQASITTPTAKLIFSIDVEHNFLLRQFEFYKTIGKKSVLSKRIEIPSLLSKNGVDFPKNVQVTSYLQFPGTKRDNAPNPFNLDIDKMTFEDGIVTFGTYNRNFDGF